MKLPKFLKHLVQKRISCRRCGQSLTRQSERAMGISYACKRAEEAHRAQQISDTNDGLFFFTIPHSKKPSAYYQSIEECMKDADKRVDSKIWIGTYTNPIPVAWDYGMDKMLKPDAVIIDTTEKK